MSLENIILREFRKDDLVKVDPCHSLIGKEDVIRDYQSIFTFENDGEPVACAGLVQLWPGVAEAWTALSVYAKSHPIWIVRALRRELKNQIAAMRLHRVQMHVEDSPHLLRWARALGFHHEGTMVKYTKEGKTLHVLAMLP